MDSIPDSKQRQQRRLGKLFSLLNVQDRASVLAFAEFLAQRTDKSGERESIREPESIPRPAHESVVSAIKRLSRTYFMLDRGSMLNETSSLMASHVIHGRPAKDVIDDLEAMFEQHYRQYRATDQDR